ncbi:MFS transporter [Lasiodiplodia theobromae]|uniref:MFS transporter n=1 Tax=Lasiodiplodia theobromae TaxID=45133 RepID=UPI0015C3B19F|nr:MFS transporter [Lasiodiplodia theobromae]KAF4545827.1 MFS transporter [Lasiodiplodia theobromae]
MQVETVDEESAQPQRSKIRLTAILTALYLSLFVAALDQTIVATAIPTIAAHLHSAAGYTWIGGAYVLAKAATMPLWAKFSDIWGRKPILLAGLAIFFVASVVCAAAPNMAALIAGRALQGVGGGALMQLVTITISDLFSMRRRSLWMVFTDVTWAVAGGVGPVLGGALAQLVSWRWVFWINLPAIGAAFVLVAACLNVHDPKTKMADGFKAIDWYGTVAILGLTLMMLLGLDFGGAIFPWSSPKVVCLLVFGALMLGFFVFSEKKLAVYPLMPMRLFNQKSNVASLVSGCVTAFVAVAAEYYLPLYFQSSKGASPIRSGVLVLPLILTTASAAASSGMLIHRTGEYRLILQVGMVFMTLGVGLFTLFNTDTSIATIVGVEVIAGIGIGLCFLPPLIALQAHVVQDDTATATSTFGFLGNLANALSIVIGGVVFQNSMELRVKALARAGLPAVLSDQLSGHHAAANVELIGTINDPVLRHAVKDAFSWSMRNMWILYASMAACGIIASFFLSKVVLSNEHTETKTGIKRKGPEPVAASS